MILASITLALSVISTTVLSAPGLRGACFKRNFTTVAIDPLAYSGSWYEIGHAASFPWGRACVCTTAEYTFLKNNSEVRVINTCRLSSPDAPIEQRKASAVVIAPGRLKVNFFYKFPLANADYEVVHVDVDETTGKYSRAVVVSCSVLGGSLVWILSRHPEIEKDDYERLTNIARSLGFDLSDFVPTKQQGCWDYRSDRASERLIPIEDVSSPVPKVCALPQTRVKNFPTHRLQTRWHIVYTQPDFVENIYSHDCFCNTVTLIPSSSIPKYRGTFQASVVCRKAKATGKRLDFVRPVFEISALSSTLGHFVQQLWGGVALEHWQILDHDDAYETMLLYTCLDTKVAGKTACVHIVSRTPHVSEEMVERYIGVAKEYGIYKEDIWRKVNHPDTCLYDPMPETQELRLQAA